MIYKQKTLVVLFGFLLFISGCSVPLEMPHKATLVVFGTMVDITVYHNQTEIAEQAIQEVEQRFQQLHHQWHAWEQGGIISKINQAIAEQQPIQIESSVKAFILKSQVLTQQSQGLFDPGIGQLISLWGFHTENWQGPPPSEADIKNWLNQRPSLLDIYFKGDFLYSKNPNVQLDFGGNVKGLAIDIAFKSLAKAGIKNAIVSIGGDMKVMGLKNNQAWSVGIQNPFDSNKLVASLQLRDGESIATSGTYQRHFDWQDKRYSHILNPNTGYPANSFVSVTVIYNDVTTADAAATAVLIAGSENWLKVSREMGIDFVFCIDKHGVVLQTEAMSKRLKQLDSIL